jgi:hypothetical protein
MQILNSLNPLFDIIIFPFASLHPFLALAFICFLINIAGLLFYKKITNQKKLEHVFKQGMLVLLEMRIRPNNLVELIGLQKESFKWTFQYLKNAFLPSLVILVPFCLLLIPIESYFSHYPIRVDTAFSVELGIKNGVPLSSQIKLEEIPPGLELIEKDIRRENIFGWHFRAKTNGEYHLTFKTDGGQISKRVVVSDSIKPLNPQRKLLGWIANLDSLEKRNVYAGDTLQWVSVNYEKAAFPYKVFGWTMDWLSFFVAVFLVLLPIFKSVAKVY